MFDTDAFRAKIEGSHAIISQHAGGMISLSKDIGEMLRTIDELQGKAVSNVIKGSAYLHVCELRRALVDVPGEFVVDTSRIPERQLSDKPYACKRIAQQVEINYIKESIVLRCDPDDTEKIVVRRKV